jgi:hypothetical protein
MIACMGGPAYPAYRRNITTISESAGHLANGRQLYFAKILYGLNLFAINNIPKRENEPQPRDPRRVTVLH